MSWQSEGRVNIIEGGDNVEQGFTKVRDDIDNVYEKLNRLRTLDSSATEPVDISEGDYWVRTTDNALMRRGASESDLAELTLGVVNDIKLKGPAVDVRAFDIFPNGTDMAQKIQSLFDSALIQYCNKFKYHSCE